MNLQVLNTSLNALKAMQTIRMEQVHQIRKTYGNEEAAKILLFEYNDFCEAQKEIEFEISNLYK